MKLERRYERIRFSEKAIQAVVEKFDQVFNASKSYEAELLSLRVLQGKDTWDIDSEEEFFLMYTSGGGAVYQRNLYPKPVNDRQSISISDVAAELRIHYLENRFTDVSIESRQNVLKLKHKVSIETVMKVLGSYQEQCRLPDDIVNSDTNPVVFIGHGRSETWRKLKDQLSDKHGYRVQAYETGARAGHTIQDVLQAMLDSSSFALLVLTKEDQMADNQMRARQNVVHELGLFQGKLGFSRAIVLLEESAEDFSNIQGIDQIRFEKIEEVIGEVLATLKREFG